MHWNILRKIFNWLILFIVTGFFAVIIYGHLQEIKYTIAQIKFIWLPLLILLIMIVSFVKSILWSYFIRTQGCYLGYDKLISIWHYSLIGNYIPGSIWMMVGRVYKLGQEGVSKKNAVYSVVMEQIINLSAGIFVVGITPQIFSTIHFPSWICLLFIPFLMLIFFPDFLGKIIWNLGVRRLDMREFPRPSIKVVFKYFIGNVFAYILAGIVVLITLKLFNVEFSGLNIFNTPGISAAAFVGGYLSLLTPNGIGVKEGIFAFLLSKHITVAAAVVIAVSRRIWSLIADGIGIICGGLYLKFKKSKKNEL